MHPSLHFTLGALLSVLFGISANSQSSARELRLFGQMDGTDTYLVDTRGNIVHTWRSSLRPGLAVYLLDDGGLLRTIATGRPVGGGGGGVQKLALDGSVVWDFRYGGSGVLSHHDVEPLPNGNVLMLAWEDKTPNQAIAAGRRPQWAGSVFRPDHIIEVQPTGPTSGRIVWKWHVWNHLIQDFDSSKANFGVVGNHPESVDINYPPAGSASDWNHCNGIDYDPVHDWIVISCRTFSEIWIIDHSTTTAEASGHTGGNYGSGGDLLYRWGNPAAYRRGNNSTRTLFKQHAANFIPAGYPGAGNMLFFNNGLPGGSAAQEIVLPLDSKGRFILKPGAAYGPAGPIWSASVGSSAILSSARRARNGNTLICRGHDGRVVEVTPSVQQVWVKQIPARIFHAHYVDRYFWSDRSTLSLNTGGAVMFDLIAGSEHAGKH